MGKVQNILFIMADQLRWDYLSCAGHPHLHTPHLDGLAAQGVRFSRCYAQASMCGPSRMSYYTGRYVSSHRSHWVTSPLSVGNRTMGDCLRPLGLRTALVGKSHVSPDVEGLAWLGIAPDSEAGVLLAEGGFEPYERDDGFHPDGLLAKRKGPLPYNEYLKRKGYGTDNPWWWHANGTLDEDGRPVSGFYMRHANRPANVAEEDSETAYMTRRAMDFITEAADEPWCLHLSYIKPHWPYMAPAPYHALYGPDHVLPAKRSAAERQNSHPLYSVLRKTRMSQSFSKDEIRERIVPTYMGLVKQIDDHVGRLLSFLEDRGQRDNTLIVFCADHGDHLGDHWLGEKSLFYDSSVRIPMIVADPRPEADETRGQVLEQLTEAIDLLPTFVEAAGGEVDHHMEGRSLLPLLRGEETPDWRDIVVSEYSCDWKDCSDLGGKPSDMQAWMVFDGRWKGVFHKRFPDQLFDLQNDPDELTDLEQSADHAEIQNQLRQRLHQWFMDRCARDNLSDEQHLKRTEFIKKRGTPAGLWAED